MTEVFVLAVALSMDAFAVSLGLGTKCSNKKLSLSLTAGLYFGFFQGLMPIIGYFAGAGVFPWVEVYAKWIAFILLAAVGAKMIYESQSEGAEDGIINLTHRVMFVLAIATSIDAMAAGFSLTLLEVNAMLACSIIGLTTFVFSCVGVFVGAKSGSFLESKAELLGGVVLILIGFKILLF